MKRLKTTILTRLLHNTQNTYLMPEIKKKKKKKLGSTFKKINFSKD